jgi:hypothetical protein
MIKDKIGELSTAIREAKIPAEGVSLARLVESHRDLYGATEEVLSLLAVDGYGEQAAYYAALLFDAGYGLYGDGRSKIRSAKGILKVAKLVRQEAKTLRSVIEAKTSLDDELVELTERYYKTIGSDRVMTRSETLIDGVLDAGLAVSVVLRHLAEQSRRAGLVSDGEATEASTSSDAFNQLHDDGFDSDEELKEKLLSLMAEATKLLERV